MIYKNTPSKRVIFEEWKEWLNCEFIHLDKPVCFACGVTVRGNWDKNSLERAHIIPESLGGKNKPDNFLLLCYECHFKAPDTTHKEDMMEWVSNQSLAREELKRIEETIDIYLPNPEEKEQFAKWALQYPQKELTDVIAIRKKECGLHSGRISFATVISTLIREWKENKGGYDR